MRISCTITGTSPLMLCRFTDEQQLALDKGSRSSFNGSKLPPHEEAESFLYRNEAGEPIMPSPNILSCLTQAGTYFKQGRSKLSTARSSQIPAAIFLDEVYYKIESESGWKVDTRPVRIPATGGRVIRHRPLFDEWTIGFGFELDEEIIGPKLARELVDTAGKRVGLGAFRPQCRGPYGRFVVQSWQQVS